MPALADEHSTSFSAASPVAGKAGLAPLNPSQASPAEFSWREYFNCRHIEAQRRMAVRQSPPKPPTPAFIPRLVSERRPVPAVARRVYALPIGPAFPGNAAAIIQDVCRQHEVTVAEICGPSRKAIFVRARHECFWMLRTKLCLSLPEIGRRMGGKDHTSVLHGINKHKRRIDSGEVAA